MNKWVLDDLKKSGITREVARKLGIKEEKDGYVFPYFDMYGEPLIIGSGFTKRAYSRKKLKTPNGTQKYSQAKGTGCHLYLPPIINWPKLLEDEEEPIWITEGEKKAVSASAIGLPCIGLGGVYSWLEKHGIIEELETFPLDNRTVSVVFDADYRTNYRVLDALIRLYRYLESRNCEVYVADLPDETKGLDDFIVAYGKREALEILKGDSLYSDFDVDEMSGSNAYEKFNRRFVMVLTTGKFIDLEDEHFAPMSRQTFIDRTNHIKAFVEVIDKRRKGGVVMKEISLAHKWLNEGEKQVVNRVGYVPIEQKLIKHDGVDIYNCYRASDVEPVKGDVTLLLDHLNYLFEGREDSVNYLLDLIAFKTQNPQIKPRVFVLIVSPDAYQIGKSAIKDICEICLGEWNIGSANQSDFGRNGVVYNEFMVEKLAFFVDEIYGIGRGGAKEVKELVKTWATDKRVGYNIKFGSKGKMTNYAIPFFFSNHLDAIKIDTKDARAFVEITTGKRRLDEEYDNLWNWMHSVDGRGAIMYYFMNRDVAHFNPMAIPMNNEAKQEITEQNMSKMALFIYRSIMQKDETYKELINIPDVLYVNHLKSLLSRYDEFREHNDEIDPRELGYVLKEAGVKSIKVVVRSRVLEGNDGVMRICIVRNMQKWDEKLSECLRLFGGTKGRTKWRSMLRDEADKAFGNAYIIGKMEHAKLLKQGKLEGVRRKSSKKATSFKPKLVQ